FLRSLGAAMGSRRLRQRAVAGSAAFLQLPVHRHRRGPDDVQIPGRPEHLPVAPRPALPGRIPLATPGLPAGNPAARRRATAQAGPVGDLADARRTPVNGAMTMQPTPSRSMTSRMKMRCLKIAAMLTVAAAGVLAEAPESAAQPRPQELAANTRV